MNISEVKEVVPYLFKAGISPMLIGYPGIGKTQSIKQLAAERGSHLVMLNLGSVEPGDLLGLPTENGQGQTTYALPDWAHEVKAFAEANPDKDAIIYLDEINRVQRDTLNAVWNLMLEKRLHTLQFPSNVYTVAAMNPDDDNHIVTNTDDQAFHGRWCYIKVVPNEKDFLDYAGKSGFHQEYLNFLTEQKEFIVHSNAYKVELPEKHFSPRDHEFISSVLNAGLPEQYYFEVINGLTTAEIAQAFKTYLANVDKPITAEQLFADPDAALKTISEKFLSGDQPRLDAIKITGEDIARHIGKLDKEYRENRIINATHKDAIERFVLLPGQARDLMYEFLTKLGSDSANNGGGIYGGAIQYESEALREYMRLIYEEVNRKFNETIIAEGEKALAEQEAKKKA